MCLSLLPQTRISSARCPLLRVSPGAGSKVVELTSDAEYESALKQLAANKSAAIIDFTAVW